VQVSIYLHTLDLGVTDESNARPASVHTLDLGYIEVSDMSALASYNHHVCNCGVPQDLHTLFLTNTRVTNVSALAPVAVVEPTFWC
jgi:hypothetical protein